MWEIDLGEAGMVGKIEMQIEWMKESWMTENEEARE